MTKARWRRSALCLAMTGGFLLAGPCGITTVQFQDFVTSTLIRTTVTTFATIVEAAVVQSATPQDGGG